MRILLDFAELTSDDLGPLLLSSLCGLVETSPEDQFETIVNGDDILKLDQVRKGARALEGRHMSICPWFGGIDSASERNAYPEHRRFIRAALIGSRQVDLVMTSDPRLAETLDQIFATAPAARGLPPVALIKCERENLLRLKPDRLRFVRLPDLQERSAIFAIAIDWSPSSQMPSDAVSILEIAAAVKPVAAIRNEGNETDHRLARLAFVITSQLGGEADDTTAKLLSKLSEFYELEVFGTWAGACNSSIDINYRVSSLDAFEGSVARFDRIVYSLCNNKESLPTFRLLQRWPGIVDLRDRQMGRLLRASWEPEPAKGFLKERLIQGHGYQAIKAVVEGRSEEEVLQAFPMHREILEHATGVLVRSKATLEDGAKCYGTQAVKDWVMIFSTAKESGGTQASSAISASNLSGTAAQDDAFGEVVAAIELAYEPKHRALAGLIENLRSIREPTAQTADDENIARFVAATFPWEARKRRLYVDVSAICRHDVHTGIQRVVRAIATWWIDVEDDDVSVMPVYVSNATGRWTHHHATRWTSHLLGMSRAEIAEMDDRIAEMAAGDILCILDFTGPMIYEVNQRESYYTGLKNIGVFITTVVYDLLPLVFPLYFPAIATEHSRWIAAVADVSDHLLCISQAVADDVEDWFRTNELKYTGQMDVFYLGADVENSRPTSGIDVSLLQAMVTFRSHPTFIMVGTIEPRKGQAQVLDAFNQIWAKGVCVNLVIIGKLGWMSEDIKDQLDDHGRKNLSLFWLSGLSDEALLAIYRAADCLIAASYGEGFGLPLIEAAQQQLPIIARDIPVFREVAADHAYYFSGDSAAELAGAVEDWLRLFASDRHPKSVGMPWLTWRESAEIALRKVKYAAFGDASPMLRK